VEQKWSKVGTELKKERNRIEERKEQKCRKAGTEMKKQRNRN
jgi:hypothetical protein